MRKINVKKPSSKFESMTDSSASFKRSSIMQEGNVIEHFYIKVDKLLPYKKQARKKFNDDSLKDLATTIREFGIRQPLSIISSEKPGFYEVISGERRLRAAKLAGLEKVPCIIISDDKNIEEIALIENLQRVDLHPVELGEAYNDLIGNDKLSIRELSKKLGVSKTAIAEQVSYANLPNEIKYFLVDKNFKNRNILRLLTKCNDLEEMKKLVGMYSNEKKLHRKRSLIAIYSHGDDIILDIPIKNLSRSKKEKIKIELESAIMKIDSL